MTNMLSLGNDTMILEQYSQLPIIGTIQSDQLKWVDDLIKNQQDLTALSRYLGVPYLHHQSISDSDPYRKVLEFNKKINYFRRLRDIPYYYVRRIFGNQSNPFDIAARFDLKAPYYFALFDTLRDHKDTSELLQIENLSSRQILDIGCGPAEHISGLFPVSAQKYALDLSLMMLMEGKKRNNLLNTNAVNADATELPFADDSFDVVSAIYSLDRMPEPIKVLDEMARVARDGGKTLIINEFPLNFTQTDQPIGKGVNMFEDLFLFVQLLQKHGINPHTWTLSRYISTDIDGGMSEAICVMLVNNVIKPNENI